MPPTPLSAQVRRWLGGGQGSGVLDGGWRVGSWGAALERKQRRGRAAVERSCRLCQVPLEVNCRPRRPATLRQGFPCTSALLSPPASLPLCPLTAASIVAKVTRDRALRDFVMREQSAGQEGEGGISTSFGR